ncbi:MAG: ATP-binding protein [Saprospiraceae bacterium]|jgi:predicted AAA+ superfamily ATPase|nr:ATP-binding protein [Saprospiraceae bacterium]HNB13150.1 ATP-binding protein [Bacteroidia bacterium]MCB0591579.1 ATP-binding protein [Saprospiraceae bacterium]MCO5281873.1 ATP-binding protein [Saprospiraceae bacterium]MCO6469991.1 ATP-binding protein [Saprospiraceae bacterium]
MITRETYLQKLRQLKDQNIIKVVTGIRRSGKSTLLEAFKNELTANGISPRSIIFLNFEERENLHLTDWTVLYDEIIIKIKANKKYYVFLDEVQLVNDFEKLINSLFTKKNIDLYVTGSNAYLLSSELATLLTGRYIAINVQPYSFKEYALAYKEEKNIDRLFRKYINASSFPEAVTLSQSNESLANDYLQSIYDTVVIKDIAQRYKLRNIHNLHRVISFVFDSIGSFISPTNIAAELNKNSQKKISHNTIIKYLDFLTNSYILYPASRFDIKGKELLTTNEKYYFVDLGLRNLTATNKYDTDLGHKLENVVYFELLRRGGKVYAGKNNDKEIDFVVQRPNNEREYYQVAFTLNDEKTHKREVSAFSNIKDNYPKYILTLDFDNTNIDGIRKLNVIDWLLNE